MTEWPELVDAIVWAIGLLILLTLALCGYIVVHRIRRVRWERRRAAVHDRWLEIIYRYLVGDAAPAELGRIVRPRDFDLLTELVLRLVDSIEGEDVEKLRILLEEVGVLQRYRDDLVRGDRWRRIQAAFVLGQLRDPNAATPLVDALRDPRPGVALAASQALARLRIREYLEDVVAAATRDEHLSDEAIAEILLEYGPSAAGALVDLAKDPQQSDRQRRIIVEILASFRHLPALSVLPGMLESASDPALRLGIVRALGMLGSPDALPPLATVARDGDWHLRAEAIKAIGFIGAAESVSALRSGLGDPEWEVRYQSAWALARIGPNGLDLLKEVAGREAESREVGIARHVLSEHEIG